MALKLRVINQQGFGGEREGNGSERTRQVLMASHLKPQREETKLHITQVLIKI